MKILVYGAGAIGTVFGGFMAQAGHEVYLIGRTQHIDAIVRNGLFIDGIWGRHHITSLKGYISLAELKKHAEISFDAIFLTVKSYDTDVSVQDLRAQGIVQCPVVSLQNGIGNIEKIAACAGWKNTVGGRVIFGAECREPGHVTVTVSADKTYIGGIAYNPLYEFLTMTAAALTGAGIDTGVTDCIEPFLWGKALYNCTLNPLATLLNVHYGRLLSCKSSKRIIIPIINELFMGMDKHQIKGHWKPPEEYIHHLFRELIPKTFVHHPSLLQDIRSGKKTEIAAMNGAVLSLGTSYGIPLPYNLMMVQLIKAKERLWVCRQQTASFLIHFTAICLLSDVLPKTLSSRIAVT